METAGCEARNVVAEPIYEKAFAALEHRILPVCKTEERSVQDFCFAQLICSIFCTKKQVVSRTEKINYSGRLFPGLFRLKRIG